MLLIAWSMSLQIITFFWVYKSLFCDDQSEGLLYLCDGLFNSLLQIVLYNKIVLTKVIADTETSVTWK